MKSILCLIWLHKMKFDWETEAIDFKIPWKKFTWKKYQYECERCWKIKFYN